MRREKRNPNIIIITRKVIIIIMNKHFKAEKSSQKKWMA
jgi:hypothetical protein